MSNEIDLIISKIDSTENVLTMMFQEINDRLAVFEENSNQQMIEISKLNEKVIYNANCIQDHKNLHKENDENKLHLIKVSATIITAIGTILGVFVVI